MSTVSAWPRSNQDLRMLRSIGSCAKPETEVCVAMQYVFAHAVLGEVGGESELGPGLRTRVLFVEAAHHPKVTKMFNDVFRRAAEYQERLLGYYDS
jgi:hypothetical protein